MRSAIFLLVFLLGNCLLLQAQDMNLEKMDEIFRAEVDEVEGENGVWTLLYGDLPVFVITDVTANRMRIFTPIIEQTELEEGQLETMLQANFHSALDAKYALYEGFVVSLFTHPLKELHKDQLIDATRQVVILAKTFGTTYTSTDMIFGGGFEDDDEIPKVNERPIKKSKRS